MTEAGRSHNLWPRSLIVKRSQDAKPGSVIQATSSLGISGRNENNIVMTRKGKKLQQYNCWYLLRDYCVLFMIIMAL